LKIKNNYPFPVKIVTETFHNEKTKGNFRGHLIVKILGARKIYNTEIVSVIHRQSGVHVQNIVDKTKPVGYHKLVEVGTPQIHMTRIRKVFDITTNKCVIDESLELYYEASDRVIVEGPKE
jgi:hypothetical protein